MRVCNVSAGWRSAAAAPRRHVITARGGDRRGGGSGGAGTQRFTPPERLLSTAPGAEQVRSRDKQSLAALAGLAPADLQRWPGCCSSWRHLCCCPLQPSNLALN